MNRQAMTFTRQSSQTSTQCRTSHPAPATGYGSSMELQGCATGDHASCAERLSPHPDIDGAWLLHLGSLLHDITFDRNQVQQDDGLSLLTWGSPLLDRLLDTAQSSAIGPEASRT